MVGAQRPQALWPCPWPQAPKQRVPRRRWPMRSFSLPLLGHGRPPHCQDNGGTSVSTVEPNSSSTLAFKGSVVSMAATKRHNSNIPVCGTPEAKLLKLPWSDDNNSPALLEAFKAVVAAGGSGWLDPVAVAAVKTELEVDCSSEEDLGSGSRDTSGKSSEPQQLTWTPTLLVTERKRKKKPISQERTTLVNLVPSIDRIKEPKPNPLGSEEQAEAYNMEPMLSFFPPESPIRSMVLGFKVLCGDGRGKLQVTMQSSSAEVTMMEFQNRKRAPAWTKQEVRDLIAVWGEESVLSELRSSFRNAKTFVKISQGMKDRGHNRDPKQCRVKLKELRQAYQKTREANGRSGSEPQICCFYDELHAILGGSATTTPAVLFDSFNGDGGNTEAGFGDEEDEEEEEVVDSSQQASRKTGFLDSQELFLTLDLEPVPLNPPKAASWTRQAEKGPPASEA
ncbi:unnamed protein product [Lepidochelys olivacea]